MKRFPFLLPLLLLLALPLRAADLEPSQVDTLLEPYFQLQKALAADKLEAGRRAAASLVKTAEGIDHSAVEEIARKAQEIVDATRFKEARQAFEPLSEEMIRLVKMPGTSSEKEVYLMFCPMAMGGMGAEWLQNDKKLVNPYYGAEMLHCGVVKGNVAER
ncbi:MAG: DUF3347 domain-containing protein [Verrucomicrobiota bacterium JB022]|nr:DUF3347 domain-containing protein [Verrucomicrobiota bacterium JB022]